MNKITRFKIVAAVCGAFISSLAAQASAAGSWIKLAQNYPSVAVASVDNIIFSLRADTYAPGSGYQLYYQNYASGDHSWYALGFLRGTALTVDAGYNIYLISLDNHVWSGSYYDTSRFTQNANNNCAGGSPVIPSQVLGHSTIAVGGGDIQIVTNDGHIATWDGTCWTTLPALPTGKAVDVSAVSSLTANGSFWALSSDEKIYGWTGAAWQAMPSSGIALGLNNHGLEIGSDGLSVWLTSGSNVVVQDTAWGASQGPIRSLGTSSSNFSSQSGFADSVALGGDLGIWYHVYGWP